MLLNWKGNVLLSGVTISTGLLLGFGYISSAYANEVITLESSPENVDDQFTIVAELTTNSSQKAQILSGTTSPTSFSSAPNVLAQSTNKGKPDSSPKQEPKEGFYFSISPGVALGRNLTGTTIINGGKPITFVGTDGKIVTIDRGGSGTLSLNSGLNISGAAGYQFNGFRVEGELLYSKQYPSFPDTTVPVSGGFQTTALMANGYYDINTGSDFKPYIGIGLGIAFNSADISGVNDYLGGQDTISGGSTNLAYQAKLGETYAVNSNLDLGLGLRLFGQAGTSAYDAYTNGTKVGTVNIDSGLTFVTELTARFRF